MLILRDISGVLHELPPAHVSEWFDHVTSAVMMTNGVYFHEDLFPSGLFIHGGKRIGARQFDADKSGVLSFTPKPEILRSVLSNEQIKVWQEAAQSFPFLIEDGAIAVATDTGRIARRTFIGLDRDGNVYMGIVPFAGLSLYELARALSRLPIPWDSVLNLDGGPSSGLFVRSGDGVEGLDSFVPVPNVIAVEPMTH